MPPCMIPVLPVFLNNHHYLKPLFLSFKKKEISFLSSDPSTTPLQQSPSKGSHLNSLASSPSYHSSIITRASPMFSANMRSSAVSKNDANLTYNRLLGESLWARSAWQRNPAYSSAGKLLYCNCTLYK